MKNDRIIVIKGISRYFPGGYWTGREIPGNTAREIPPRYFPDNPDLFP